MAANENEFAEHLADARLPAPDMVREQLRRLISSGSFAPGFQLRQDELAERFGTSRIPVREALRQLEAEGFVTFLPNRGVVVAALSLEQILELMEIRQLLECHALRLAIPEMCELDLDTATELLRSYDAAPGPEHWGEMNWAFHRTLYAPCRRPRLLTLIESNYGHVSRFIRASVSRVTGKERPQREHYEMLELCREGNIERAIRLLSNHIGHTQKLLLASERHRNAR